MKDQDIVVAFGALGSTIHLNDKASRFNGASQHLKLLRVLCRNPRIKHVVILGTLGKESVQPEVMSKAIPDGWEKIIYPETVVRKIALALEWDKKVFYSAKLPDAEGKREEIPYHTHRYYQDLYAKYCAEQLPKIDFGLFFISQGWCGTNIGYCVRKITNPDEYRVQLPMAAKCGSHVHTINLLNFPWFMLSTDDRVVYSMSRHDTTNLPKCIMGQWDTSYDWEVIKSYEDVSFKTVKLDVKYAGLERLNLIDEPIISPDTERTNKFSIVANQSTCSNDLSCQRFKELKRWVLDFEQSKTFNIYGEWDNAYITGYRPSDNSKQEHRKLIDYNKRDIKDLEADIIYPQFKGRTLPSEIDSIFENTRYTLCIPVIPGYLTSKFVEMIRCGVLPFVIDTYDSQCKLIGADDPVRVKTPQELYERMQWFEENPNGRIELVKYYQNKYVRYASTGGFIQDSINRFLKMYNIDVEI